MNAIKLLILEQLYIYTGGVDRGQVSQNVVANFVESKPNIYQMNTQRVCPRRPHLTIYNHVYADSFWKLVYSIFKW